MRKYYEIRDKVPKQKDAALEEQRHINRAYCLFKAYMREMLLLQHGDVVLDEMRRDMYNTEDRLWQYVQRIPK